MFDIVRLFEGHSNQGINLLLLTIASFRIYLEIIDFKFDRLPLTKGMFQNSSEAIKFHRTGLYFCIGYILLFGPSTILS